MTFPYKFEIADVEQAERPEYETRPNKAWRIELEAVTAVDLLSMIADWLNDENTLPNKWARITFKGVPQH